MSQQDDDPKPDTDPDRALARLREGLDSEPLPARLRELAWKLEAALARARQKE